MAIPQETMQKMEALPSEKMAIIVQIVDQMSASPLDRLRDLRKEGQKNPLTDDEIDNFVDSVRNELYASGS